MEKERDVMSRLQSKLQEIRDESNEQYIEKLELDQDIYSYCFVAHLCSKDFQQKDQDLVIRKAFLVFLLQIGLSWFFLSQMNNEIQPPSTRLQLVRLMCGFVMHMIIHPEVKSSLQMMAFLKHNKQKRFFHRRLSAFVISLMKMTAGIFVEVIQLLMISQQDNIEDIIKDFVALGFIIELDNILAKNVSTQQYDAKIEEIADSLVIDRSKSRIKRICKLFCRSLKAKCGCNQMESA